MQDYIERLMIAINRFDENNEETVNNLRDLVCWISDNDDLKKDDMVKELLYIASQKMRVFGYNILNKFNQSPLETNDIDLIREESIKNLYRSKVYSNNILDKTQKNIIDCFQNLQIKRLLVSAPTSYGKTFLMREILYMNRDRYNKILLVFPTVALLLENARAMEKFVKDLKLDYQVIKTVDSVDTKKKSIFVFTPERALQLIAKFPDMKLDFFFFDEVYKIDEDYFNDESYEENNLNKYGRKNFLDVGRAKTFRIALYLLSKSVPEYYLAGPNLKKDQFGLGMKNFIEKNNIHFEEVDFEPTLRISVNAYGNKIKEELPEFTDANSKSLVPISSKVNDKVKDIVSYIGNMNYGKTLLYCTTPAKATEYSNKLAESLNYNKKCDFTDEFKMFIEHIKTEYDIEKSSEEWSLIKVLNNGFGLHHGKLPKYIQQEILEQFNSGAFDVLFCTSTIVEGVNTDAQNMIIINKSKGRTELTPFDIKNIKGRAGRYYHCFVGRVFYMDKKLIEIEKSEDLKLDFATYSDNELGNIDIDNSDLEDLERVNYNKKIYRNKETADYLITDATFKMNRTIPKDDQEQLLRYLMKPEVYREFSRLTYYDITVDGFFTYKWMSKIIYLFKDAGLIDESIAKMYYAVSTSYYNDGFKGILGYQLKNKKISVDDAYSKSFDTLKDTIEHKIPKLLSLFESVFIQVANYKGNNCDAFSMSRITRFYETGVKTVIGESLIEYGFPTDAIRRLEAHYYALSNMNIIEAKEYCLKLNNLDLIFDPYEFALFKKALNSI